jgi:hypothetical protein
MLNEEPFWGGGQRGAVGRGCPEEAAGGRGGRDTRIGTEQPIIQITAALGHRNSAAYKLKINCRVPQETKCLLLEQL